ncbi:MAG: DNA polymerase III subunit alpha [Clostridia bacterium]|nr:DNA polymerase III subunit alpha [Clostridia bacterium]
MCIQTNTTVEDGRPLGFETDEFFYKSTEEMQRLFPDVPEAIENTQKIADRCHFDFQFDKLYLPVFKTPDGSMPSAYLRRLAAEGFEEKCADGRIVFSDAHPMEEYRTRIEYELSVICAMGYAEYYLIVWDFIHYAKSVGIPVGPGRGSGAGSLVAYLIGITDVDSIRFSLMFERFLNPERVSMPDFDIDFCDTRRGEVIDYVRRRYGEDHVAQIITFGTLAARAAVRDVGRALGMSFADTDIVAKAIPQELGMTLEKAMELPDLKALMEGDRKVKTLLETAQALEGMPRHASTHAAGVVITDRPVSEYVPLAENGGMTVTQFDMDTVAALGLLKIDFLGLRYLTIIEDAEKQVRETKPDFDITRVPFDDPATYEMIGAGKTAGVFQLESGGMRAMLQQLTPDNLEMIVAAISLYRPGPMDSIPKFIDNRLHPEKIVYPTPVLGDILDVTFGCIVYQEQVMQICRAVAGYSYARADLVRRAMAKKKASVMEKEREIFINGSKAADGSVEIPGAVAMGVDKEVAEQLFDDMASFARYAFNKSHASAYAFTSYRTAYLKRHYPGEYFSALLTSVSGSMNKTAEYIAEAGRFHIPILAPDINESTEYFHVSRKGGKTSIRFGLLAVKNVGIHFVEEILTERKENGLFTDFEDFVSRMSMRECSKRQVEALIKCGAFDALPQQRSQLYACYEKIVDLYADRARTTVTGQMDLFSAVTEQPEKHAGRAVDGFAYPAIPEFTMKEKLMLERDATGQYFSGHLLDDYSNHIERLQPAPISDIIASFTENEEDGGDAVLTEPPAQAAYRDKQIVTVAGTVAKRVSKITKKGDNMAFVTIEDRYASMEVIIFPKTLEACAPYLLYDTAILVTGELSVKEEEDPKLIARTVLPLKTNEQLEREPDMGQPQSPRDTNTQNETPVQNPVRNKRPPRRVSDTPIPENPRCLYLRVPDTEESEKFALADNLTEIFSGTLPVMFYSEKTKTYQKKNTGVMLSPYILYQFEELLGRENVILK